MLGPSICIDGGLLSIKAELSTCTAIGYLPYDLQLQS